MSVEIGLSLQKQYPWPYDRMLPLLKKYGFSFLSPVWLPDVDMDDLVSLAHRHGMTVQSFHAPHKGIPLMWDPVSAEADAVENNILCCVDDCAKFAVPVMVIHGWCGFDYTFEAEKMDFSRFDRVVERAGKKGVSVAFENLEGEEFLCALLSRYRRLDHVGFCWDSGHDHCYLHQTDFLEEFGDRLIMTHINDNFGLRDLSRGQTGKDDLHYLPFDGNIDWAGIVKKLGGAKRQEILNFEIKVCLPSADPSDILYERLTAEAFCRLAGERCMRVAKRYGARVACNQNNVVIQ